MFSICFVTTPSMEVSKKIASSLVTRRLIACANILPGAVSIYEWQGKIECDEENLMIMKTQTANVSEIIKEVKALHPYDCPEVISYVQGEGSPEYLKWLKENTNYKEAAIAAAVAAGGDDGVDAVVGKSEEKKENCDSAVGV